MQQKINLAILINVKLSLPSYCYIYELMTNKKIFDKSEYFQKIMLGTYFIFIVFQNCGI